MLTYGIDIFNWTDFRGYPQFKYLTQRYRQITAKVITKKYLNPSLHFSLKNHSIILKEANNTPPKTKKMIIHSIIATIIETVVTITPCGK